MLHNGHRWAAPLLSKLMARPLVPAATLIVSNVVYMFTTPPATLCMPFSTAPVDELDEVMAVLCEQARKDMRERERTSAARDAEVQEESPDIIVFKIGDMAITREMLRVSVLEVGKPCTLRFGMVKVQPVRDEGRSYWTEMNMLTKIGEAVVIPATTTAPETTSSQAGAHRVDRAFGDITTPELAKFERGRELKQKPPVGKRGRASAERTAPEPISITAQMRVNEFPGCGLYNSVGKLFCRCCKVQLPLIKSSITHHLKTEKHKVNHEQWLSKNGEDSEIKEYLTEYFEQHKDEAHGTLDADLLLYRYRTVESCMAKGIPIEKIDGLRPLLERAGKSLTDSSHLRTFIPKIEERELAKLRVEHENEFVAIIFDGTTRLGEAINVCTRFCPADFSAIFKRLVAFKTVAKHMDGAGLFKLLSIIIAKQLQISYDQVVCGGCDSCSTNGVARRSLKTLCTGMSSFLCVSHTLHHTGEHMGLDTVEEFLTPLLLLISHSETAKSLWKQLTGTAMVAYSTIRWWSRWEVMKMLGTYFHHLSEFIDTLIERGIGDATTRQLKHVYTTKTVALQLELAAAMDVEILCTTTYKMEGDGLEILLVYDALEAIRNKGRTLGDDASSMPILAGLMRAKKKLILGTPVRDYFEAPWNAYFTGTITKLPATNAGVWEVTFSDGNKLDYDTEHEIRQVLDVTKMEQWQPLVTKVKGGFTYLENRLTDNCDSPYHLKVQHEATKLLRVFDPSLASDLVDANYVDALRAIDPLVEHDLIEKMKAELPFYLSACSSASLVVDHGDVKEFTTKVLKWWALADKSKFPTWAVAARIVFSFTPNSAACERVFSLLKFMFGDQQWATLGDYIQSALMLNYNERAVG